MDTDKLTTEQERYQRFDKRSRVLIYAMFSLLPILIVLFFICMHHADENGIPLLVIIVVLIVYTVCFIGVTSKIVNRRYRLHFLAYGNADLPERTGLFKDIWEEFERNDFKWEYDGKSHYAEPNKDSIVLSIKRKKKYFTVDIDANELYMAAEQPGAEDSKVIPLS